MEKQLIEQGFVFKKRYGQNFLSDRNLLGAIVRDAGVSKSENVLEIGTGMGALTRVLSEHAARVVSYEIDTTLRPILAETLSGCDNVEVVFRDFSKEDLSQIERDLKSYQVVANLPYYLTTPILMRFVEESVCCRKLCVMVQEEVAQRMCAVCGTGEYGALTAAIARRGECRVLRKVPKDLFYPRPKVDSAVVSVDFTQGGFDVISPEAYRLTVRCAFLNRRKTLENNLMSGFSLSREAARGILEEAEIDEGIRGEALSPQKLGKLSDLLCAKRILI